MKISLFQIIFLCTLVDAKYEIYLDRVENAENNTMLEYQYLRVRKFNRSSTVVDGSFRLKKLLDNSINFYMEAYNLQGNQYKMLFSKNFGPACDTIWDPLLEHEIRRAMKCTNMTFEYGTCPIQSDTWTLNHYTPEGKTDYLPPYVPGNERWKIRIYYMKNEVNLGHFDTYLLIRDEQKIFDGIASG